MAEQPDIVISNSPDLINLSFGKNIFSFYDQNTTGAKATIQVWDNTLTTQVAELEQYPNSQGYYHFDLQNIIKNYTTPNYSIEGGTSQLKTVNDESFSFKVKYGYKGSTSFQQQGTYPNSGATDNCVVFGGRKNYDELEWNYTQFQPVVNGIIGCPVVGRQARALSEWTLSQQAGDLEGGYPYWVPSQSDLIYTMKKKRYDAFNLSFINSFESTVATPPTGCKNIKAFFITFYKGDTLYSQTIVENVTGNGGGPSTTVPLDANIVYPYDAITFKCGYPQFQSEHDNLITHYYVAGFTYKGSGCSGIETDYEEKPVTQIYRVDIVEDKCLDFEEVQVSWLNKYGFRDYWYFTKRQDTNINIRRNTYEQVEGSWNSDVFEVESYDRGENIFSQDITVTKTINTDFLSDYEASFLKDLYLSSDVRVKYGQGEWIPIIVTSNRWSEKTFRKDKLFQNTLNYREAHKINSQRG